MHENKQKYNKSGASADNRWAGIGWGSEFYICRCLDKLEKCKSEEMNSKIGAGNRCLYSLEQIFSSRSITKSFKIKIYITMVKPVVVHGSEKWHMTDGYEHMGDENIKEVMWTDSTARNMRSNN
jgi:hypothetical protein